MSKPQLAIKIAAWVLGAHALVAVVAFAAFQLSPWPSVWLIRYAFDLGGAATAKSLLKHAPANVSSILNERYDDSDNALLDVYFPSQVANTSAVLRTVVWIHGGGFVAGDKDEIAGYLKVLASRGFTVVGMNYALAPDHRYPKPVVQVDAALMYLKRHAQRLHIEPHFVLAGDSAGAHIATQFANAVSSPHYARAVGVTPALSRANLIGVVLYCGPYDFKSVRPSGARGVLMRGMPWAYTGVKEFVHDARFDALSVPAFVTSEFPPAFISVGNADSLAPQSRALADALVLRGVRVDTLFFSHDHQPPLPHEYQFNLDSDAGKLALERSIAFLSAL
jgi:acetyl esterase